MPTIHSPDRSHPIVACADTVTEAVKDVAAVEPVFMSTTDKATALVRLARAEAALAEVRLRVLAVAGDVAETTAARDAAVWFSQAVQADPGPARADLHLATALPDRDLVAAGMREGVVSPAQARVIVAGLDALPDHLDAETVRSAEETLVGYCDRHRPRELRVLARRILEVVSPETVEAEEAARLEDEERKAREGASLRFTDLGDGRTRITGTLATTLADRLKAYLDAYASPRRHHGGQNQPFDGHDDPVPQHRRRAHAFASLLELLDPDRLPAHGGLATTVIVTIGMDQLRADLATAGHLAHEDLDISAEEARRLACTAGIIPAVLDGKGQVLDLGRTQRLFNTAQRRALRVRDRQCRAEGCDMPAAWTEAHHLTPWSRGGPTDLANATSLCSHHHHRIHDRAYQWQRLAGGDIRFSRRSPG